jgi:hypothetical protein
MAQPSSRNPNRVLSELTRADFALLKPHLVPVKLPLEASLETANNRIDSAYFIDSGFASVLSDAVVRCLGCPGSGPNLLVDIIERQQLHRGAAHRAPRHHFHGSVAS